MVAALTMVALAACADGRSEATPAASQPAKPRHDASHPACAITDADRACTADADCVYVGTHVVDGECCYDPCGGGAAVNRGAADRIEAAREPLLVGPRDAASHCADRSDVKCSYGGVECHAGRCRRHSR
ncbi:MAG TPA: hypothetical protein VG755_19675 [Nannocystaceae bacterium]|nr:hypothetical protein [Nannocystaceae bacterium]